MPSKQGLVVKNYWDAAATAMAERPTLDETRDRVETQWPTLTREPGGVDFLEVDAGGVPAMWIVPRGVPEDRVLFALHGGGFISGSIHTHRKMHGHLAKATGCRVLSVEYRLAPEHAYPAQIDDALRAYRWLLAQGVDARRIAFTGDSSGGGLALSTILRARDENLPLPACAVTFSAWLDLTLSGESYQSNREKDRFFQREGVDALAQLYLGPSGDRKDPHISALFGHLAGFPPVYLQAGADETLFDESRQFAERAKEAGVDVRFDAFPEMLHTFQMAAGRAPEADDAIRRAAEWVRPRLGLTS